jgi:cytochrome P450
MTEGDLLSQQPTLMLTDLRALSHVFDHTDVYQKPKALVRFLTRLVGGSVLVAEGEPHRIQRKTLNPAFGAAQIRDQTGIFVDKAEEVYELRSTLHVLLANHSARVAQERSDC